MDDSDRRKLQAYLARPLDDLMSELELYDPTARGPAEVWEKVEGPLRRFICVDMDYCKVRLDPRLDDDLTLAAALVSWLAEGALSLPIPADKVLLAVILVKRGLDAFCGCL